MLNLLLAAQVTWDTNFFSMQNTQIFLAPSKIEKIGGVLRKYSNWYSIAVTFIIGSIISAEQVLW